MAPCLQYTKHEGAWDEIKLEKHKSRSSQKELKRIFILLMGKLRPQRVREVGCGARLAQGETVVI